MLSASSNFAKQQNKAGETPRVLPFFDMPSVGGVGTVLPGSARFPDIQQADGCLP